jgi:hypothetical protein
LVLIHARLKAEGFECCMLNFLLKYFKAQVFGCDSTRLKDISIGPCIGPKPVPEPVPWPVTGPVPMQGPVPCPRPDPTGAAARCCCLLAQAACLHDYPQALMTFSPGSCLQVLAIPGPWQG